MGKNVKIVVTGAAGMIGSGIVRHLNDQGRHDLLLVDDLKKGEKWKNLVGKHFVDLISRHALLDWLHNYGEGIEAIVHMGACSDTVESDGDYLLENNFRFTVRLAEWALQRGVRFVYASSAATYGDGSLGFEDDESRLEELKPLNLYAFSKQLVDLWMQREKVLDRVVGLKYFNVFGPNEYHKGRMASMVLKMSHKAQMGEAIELFQSNDPSYVHGGQMRDFIYVKDAVKMTCAFLDPKYRHVGGIYNVGQGAAITWNDLADALFRSLERKSQIKYVEMPPDLMRQYQKFTCASMGKLRKVFSSDPQYVSTVPVSESVREYVRDYLLRWDRW